MIVKQQMMMSLVGDVRMKERSEVKHLDVEVTSMSSAPSCAVLFPFHRCSHESVRERQLVNESRMCIHNLHTEIYRKHYLSSIAQALMGAWTSFSCFFIRNVN
jgi:hypothetical protein